jgi:hypothetical protein
MSKTFRGCFAIAAFFLPAAVAFAQSPPGEGPALGTGRTSQDAIASGAMSLREIRKAGLKMFATPFNKLDGYGDGIENPFDTTSPGGRPTLQNNGTFLRVNGLDAQTCMECHSVGSNAVAPFRFAVGGAGGANNNAVFQPRHVDVSDQSHNGFAAFDGRFINPPFLFGSGGVQLLANEMTAALQKLKTQAHSAPGTSVPLLVKGVSFGSISFDTATSSYDTSHVSGIASDLVLRAFGRKGEFSTVRRFDVEALQFHMGMQPVEAVGEGVDADNDGVVDEVLVGEVSALDIFNTNLEHPVTDRAPNKLPGFATFNVIGCADCHRPALETTGRTLTYSFPEVETDPSANVFYSVDLHSGPAGFDLNGKGGLIVPLFSDLKRHEMGPALAESTGGPLDSKFITARLWGVADSAPYLHDGRATTLTEAIELHGGEATVARNNFASLPAAEKSALLAFLRNLRTPLHPAQDIVP